MSPRKILVFLLFLGTGAAWMCAAQQPGAAEEKAEYVGADKCSMCHKDIAAMWAQSVHRRTLFNKEPERNGCEACHGPGAKHMAAGGGKGTMVNLTKLSPKNLSEKCMGCHTQEKLMLWHTSRHARAKMSCASCHDPHSLETGNLLRDMDAGKLDVEGLNRSIKQAELAADIAPDGSKAKEEALAQVVKLNAKRAKLQDELKGQETPYKHAAEPYLCFNCHKKQQLQSKMLSHHPVTEGKMKCSECHNPHGGLNGMLAQEEVAETCYRCHAEKVGPFTFEHAPVNEDCTICHNPHGSPRNNLLAQAQPFLCLKCHAGPHTRSGLVSTPTGFAQRYTECTECHNQIHGSDRHQAFMF